MFRRVRLPDGVDGAMFLHSMPGRYEPLTVAQTWVTHDGITRVVCLASFEEIGQKSPTYANAIRQGDLPWTQQTFEIRDYGIPEDRNAFLKLAQDVATSLQRGEHILIHCGAGVGRTGMLAVCILLVLGLAESDARAVVRVAGSGPERPEQDELVRWVASQVVGA